MSIMMYDSFEGDQSFETQTWTQVATKSGNLNVTGNFIHISAEYGGSAAGIDVGIRVLLDGVERSFDYHRPSLANQYRKFCDFGIYTPAEAGSHTITLEVRALSSGQTVLVRRIRIMVTQV